MVILHGKSSFTTKPSQHISAPLMGFEVLKLIQQFRKEGVEQAPQDGDKDEAEPKIFIDYK